MEEINNWFNNSFDQIPEMPTIYSEELIGLIRSMLQREAEKRPSVNRILREPFIRKYDTLITLLSFFSLLLLVQSILSSLPRICFH